FPGSSAFFHAHRCRSPAHRRFSVLIAVVPPLISSFPCSSLSFFRSSALFHAHRSRSSAHRRFSMLIAVVLSLIRVFPCSSVGFTQGHKCNICSSSYRHFHSVFF